MSTPESSPPHRMPVPSKKESGSQKQLPQRQTSQKKIEVNQRNSLRSTGPKTERGKGHVACNARKHGLLAREVVITHGDGAENPDEFAELRRELRKDRQPVGITEEQLVETIADCRWRLARVQRYETGQLRKGLDNAGVTLTLEQLDKPNLNLWQLHMEEYKALFEDPEKAQTPPMQEWLPIMQRSQSELRKHPIGIKHLQRVLATVKQDIHNQGYVSEENKKFLIASMGLCDHSLVEACLSLDPPKSAPPQDGALELKSDTNSMAQRESALRLIDLRSEMLSWLQQRAKLNQALQLEAEIRSPALADAPAMSLVLRCEAHWSRRLDRAMDRLERRSGSVKGRTCPRATQGEPEQEDIAGFCETKPRSSLFLRAACK